MDRRFLTVLGVSLLFALVVSSIFYQMSARAGNRSRDQKKVADHQPDGGGRGLAGGRADPGPPTSSWSTVPRDRGPNGAFEKIEEVVGRPVISNILRGRAHRGGAAGRARQRLRAVAGDPDGHARGGGQSERGGRRGGFSCCPACGSTCWSRCSPPGEAGARTSTILQNILVVSAGQQCNRIQRTRGQRAGGHSAGDAGTGRDADAGRQRGPDPVGAAQLRGPGRLGTPPAAGYERVVRTPASGDTPRPPQTRRARGCASARAAGGGAGRTRLW